MCAHVAAEHVFDSNLVSPPGLAEAGLYVLLVFYFIYTFLVISFRPIISTSTEPIFTKFAGIAEVWP